VLSGTLLDAGGMEATLWMSGPGWKGMKEPRHTFLLARRAFGGSVVMRFTYTFFVDLLDFTEFPTVFTLHDRMPFFLISKGDNWYVCRWTNDDFRCMFHCMKIVREQSGGKKGDDEPCICSAADEYLSRHRTA
jgi:hypothetical protein